MSGAPDPHTEANRPLRWPARLAMICLLIAPPIGNRMRHDLAFQDFMSSFPGVALMLLLWTATLIGVERWSRADRERQVFVISAAGGTALIVTVVVLANVYGWFAGTLVRPSPLIQLLVFTPHIAALVVFPLAAYRRLSLRWPLAALAGYLIWVVIFSVISVPAEEHFIKEGIVRYQNGYTMREDILWGALMYLLALSLYAGCVRRLEGRDSRPRHG